MIAWLGTAFGFEVHLALDEEDGQIPHAELIYGDAILMVSPSGGGQRDQYGVIRVSPSEVDLINTQTLQVYVDDLDAHYSRARVAGARITTEPFIADHGEAYWADKSYGALDPEGHLWWFVERLRG